MSGYLWWLAEQGAGTVFGWVGRNPEAASLIGVGLASPATRGFTMDLVKVVGKESIRSSINIMRGIGGSLIQRSSAAGKAWAGLRASGRWLSRGGSYLVRSNPLFIPAALAVAGTVAQSRSVTEAGAGTRGSPGSIAPSYHLDDSWGKNFETGETTIDDWLEFFGKIASFGTIPH